jgi:SAM-dependent methyltransferase
MNIFRKIYFKLFAHKIVRENVDYKRDKHEDRSVLETIIFPHVLSKFNPQTILDIGREDYQHFYNSFFKNRTLWTLDFNPKREEFGADNHITDDVANLKKHFHDNEFDFVLMNGVFGWGLNKAKPVEEAFNAIYDILKPGGLFILGYNSAPIPLEKINGLNKLKKYFFPPLKGETFECSNGDHKYNFYIKE